MRKFSASWIAAGALIGLCCSFGYGDAVAQAASGNPPSAATAPAAPAATPAAPISVRPPVPGVAKPTGKQAAPQSSRKYERSYKHCKARAFRRGLKGVERRAFIRRCELGFAPPRSQTPPVAVPPGAPAQQTTPPPARK